MQGDPVSQGFRTLLSQYVTAALFEKLEPLHSVKTPEHGGPFNEILQSTLSVGFLT